MKEVRLRAVPSPAVPDRATRMAILDDLLRQKASELIQAALVAEADEVLGRIAGVGGKSSFLETNSVHCKILALLLRKKSARLQGLASA